jgi:hypothetical protein
LQLGIQFVRDGDFDSDIDGMRGEQSPSSKATKKSERCDAVISPFTGPNSKTSPCFGKAVSSALSTSTSHNSASNHSMFCIGEEYTSPAASASGSGTVLPQQGTDLNKNQNSH